MASAVRKAKNLTKVDDDEDIPLAFRWVMAAAAATSSSSLTIGENNEKKNMCRAAAWVILVYIQANFMAASASSAYIMYKKPIWQGNGFPWFVAVVMLCGVYMAVVHMAMHHLVLFLPRAPMAAWEALRHVGFEKVGVAVCATSGLVLLFDHYARWMLVVWCCLAGALIAAVLAFWICLIRMYGDSSSWGGLAIGMALSSLFAAALSALLIHLFSYGD